MKNITFLISFLLLCTFGYAQKPPMPKATMPAAKMTKADKPKQVASPLDSSTVTTSDGVTINIRYGSPSLKGREIGVDLVKPGERWRTGANETTTIEFDKNVTVNGQKLPAGKYGLNTIPGEQSSTLIFNKNWQQWGTKFEEKDDVLKVEVPNETTTASLERLKITADQTGKIHLGWGNYGLSMDVKADQ